jgi:hypothetical protein
MRNAATERARRYQVYQLRLMVRRVSPPIWRRIRVRSDVTLARLHTVIQVLMGWYDYHLYQFRIANEPHGPQRDDDAEYGTRKSVRISLSTAFSLGLDTIIYEYDFGDGWEVNVKLEKRLPQRVQRAQVVCIDGARHGPMEDSGGPAGYQEKLEILKNPDHEEHTEIRDWIGHRFDSEWFDVRFINGLLREVERSKGRARVLMVFWEMRHSKSSGSTAIRSARE